MPAPARLRAHSRHTVTAKASVLALGVLLASTACSGSPSAAPAAVRSAPASPEAAVAVTAQPTPDLPPGTITLAFGGDVHFTERTAPRLNATPADPALGPMSKTVAAADFAMVNLETAITTRGAAEPKLYHFRTPPSALTALQASGVDAVSMANNHAVDYGPAGLADTLDAVHHAPIPVLGIGANEAEAYKPYVKNIRGVRLAVVAASQVMDLTNDKFRAGPRKPGIASALDQAKLIAAVKRAKAEADVVVVYLHWGTEGQSCPGPEQKSIAAKLSAAGATAVVGTHAHVMLGSGMLGRSYVNYGLGNLLWYGTSPYPRSNDSGIATLTIAHGKVVKQAFAPAVVDGRGVPMPQSGAAAKSVTDRLASLRGCAALSPGPRS
ncbi:CapA family protein [Streptomyces xanthochromogenes]|uniref:Capsular polysaccharide biosynthesis protein n=1 Tax=Streptomyces xanthochromogenes TaxID=67384 RepID=A0ABQ2ZTQ9_9ACTN|nr:CapA family protein [Streptomyces xanthochromogenes]GGY22211.1 capsular polysaccharide biosynthesis protein [Streptomyces xanthochromogenes]